MYLEACRTLPLNAFITWAGHSGAQAALVTWRKVSWLGFLTMYIAFGTDRSWRGRDGDASRVFLGTRRDFSWL
jgi:hypothetical protein